MRRRKEGYTQDFGGEFRRKRDHLENHGIDGRVILTWTFKKCDQMGDIGLINLTQDRDSWQTLVNVVMNLWVPLIVGNFLTLLHRVV
jgi:hypothetical protein